MLEGTSTKHNRDADNLFALHIARGREREREKLSTFMNISTRLAHIIRRVPRDFCVSLCICMYVCVCVCDAFTSPFLWPNQGNTRARWFPPERRAFLSAFQPLASIILTHSITAYIDFYCIYTWEKKLDK